MLWKRPCKGENVELGEAVEVIAGSVHRRTWHSADNEDVPYRRSSFKIVEQTVLEAKNSGTIKFININTVKNREGLLVADEQKRKHCCCRFKGQGKRNTLSSMEQSFLSATGRRWKSDRGWLNGILIQLRY